MNPITKLVQRAGRSLKRLVRPRRERTPEAESIVLRQSPPRILKKLPERLKHLSLPVGSFSDEHWPLLYPRRTPSGEYLVPTGPFYEGQWPQGPIKEIPNPWDSVSDDEQPFPR
jgi:hypothetical protein